MDVHLEDALNMNPRHIRDINEMRAISIVQKLQNEVRRLRTTQRFDAACAAMQGALHNYASTDVAETARFAVDQADALLAALDKEKHNA